MDRESISDLVHRLNDVELAVLLCLVADGHCILTSEENWLARLAADVEGIIGSVFGLAATTVNVTDETTLDEFVTGLLVAEARSPMLSPLAYDFLRPDIMRSVSDGYGSGRKKIPNVVVVRGLDTGNMDVQVQVLELMRTRRVTTRKVVLEVPDRFLLVAVLPKTNALPALFKHLREHFFISHYHAPDDEDLEVAEQSDADSLASVVIHKPAIPSPRIPFYIPGKTLVPQSIVNNVRQFAGEVSVSTEIRRYLLDIVVFLRMHRAVRGGSISAIATDDFELLVRCLAPLHNLDYATPALVSLAVFKIYAHRIDLVQRAQDERSILYGSSVAAVEHYLKQMDVEAVIEDVLSKVRAPL